MKIKQILPKELQKLLTGPNPPFLVDVRENDERAFTHIGGHHIPLGEIQARCNELPKDQEIVVYCKAGGRNMRACEFLAQQGGFTQVTNVVGGILRWADEVDPSIKKY